MVTLGLLFQLVYGMNICGPGSASVDRDIAAFAELSAHLVQASMAGRQLAAPIA